MNVFAKFLLPVTITLLSISIANAQKTQVKKQDSLKNDYNTQLNNLYKQYQEKTKNLQDSVKIWSSDSLKNAKMKEV